jgi:hypothetical protein
MANSSENTHKIFSSRIHVPASTYVGESGRLFYHEDTGELRISDGATPGGLPIFFQSNGSSSSGGVSSINVAGPNLSIDHTTGDVTITSNFTGPTNLGNITILNSGQVGPNTGNIALTFNRGTSGNVQLVWVEPLQAFAFVEVPPNGNFTIGNSAPVMTGTQYISTGNFAVAGDARACVYIERNITMGTAPTRLYLDGIGENLIMSPNSIWTYDILVSAKRTDAGADGASFRITGAVGCNATPSTIFQIGVPSITIIGRTDDNWNAHTSIDAVTGSLIIIVVGNVGKTVRWVAKIDTTEVSFN